jgi:TRAP-type transport system small permease protein
MMTDFIEALSKAYETLLRALAILACALLFLMMCLVCADILLRNAHILPGVYGLPWTDEVSESSLYLIALLAAPWLLRREQHIRVDILLQVLPQRLARYGEWLVDVLALICCLTVTYYGARTTIASYQAGYMTMKTLTTPEWWHLSVIPAAFFLLSCEMLFRMRRLYLSRGRTRTSSMIVR